MNYLLLCYFISAILAILFSTEFYKCVVNRTENILTEENPSKKAGIKNFAGTLASYGPIPISKLLASGIHVPLILLLSGYIIRQRFHRVAKTDNLFTIPMMKKAIMYMALTCDIALTLLDWTLGLFVLALILGKFIWIDFVYDEVPIQTQFAKIIDDYKTKAKCSSTLC